MKTLQRIGPLLDIFVWILVGLWMFTRVSQLETKLDAATKAQTEMEAKMETLATNQAMMGYALMQIYRGTQR